jgi:hypothetical protein
MLVETKISPWHCILSALGGGAGTACLLLILAEAIAHWAV